MKTLRLAFVAALLSTACDYDVPNLNQPGLESLQNPTIPQVNALATGLLIGARTGVTERVGVLVEWGVLGREALVLTASDPRFVSQLLSGPLSAGDANFGGDFWVIPYANIRNANLLLHALDAMAPAPVGLTDAQKDAVRGFAKTLKVVDYLQVVDSHDVNGAVLDADHPLDTTPGPIVTSLDQIYTFLEGLLDEAQTNLNCSITAACKAGSDPALAFPFKLGTGFTGFDAPATFLPFNRALRARVSVYHGKFTDALTALGQSFIDPTTPGGTPTTPLGAWPGTGVFHAFGGASGDLPNDLNDTSIFCHSSTVTDAEALALPPLPCTGLACLDQRVQGKVKLLSSSSSDSTGHSSQYAFTMYPGSSSPIPIIRNEELILLRAEANIGAGNLGPARQDINYVRQAAGLSAHAPFANAAAALDELLKQKRYSLLFEGGHRWIDLRRYNKLDFTHVAQDAPADVIHPSFPIPVTETQARP